MSDNVRLACESEVVTIQLARILPMRMLDAGIKATVKYKCIEASIKELGLIEPMIVFPQPGSSGLYMLLDGHMRHVVLTSLGEESAKCLIAFDDEAYTYNHKVSRLSAIQEHFMIRRAIKNGVSEERIARSLDVDVSTIRQKRDMLEGICPEAVKLLKDRRTSAQTFRELRRVVSMRQIEIAELMCATNNYKMCYIKCLIAATPVEQVVEGDRPKEFQTLTPEDVSRIENEMTTLSRDFKVIEESHGKNTLHLVIVLGYLRKMLDNVRIVKYLALNHAEVLAELQKLVDNRALKEQAFVD